MGLSRTVSETEGDFSYPPLVFCPPPAEGVPLRIGYRRFGQKLEWWGYRTDKEVWGYLKPSGYNAPTWRTDEQTDRHRPSREQL